MIRKNRFVHLPRWGAETKPMNISTSANIPPRTAAVDMVSQIQQEAKILGANVGPRYPNIKYVGPATQFDPFATKIAEPKRKIFFGFFGRDKSVDAASRGKYSLGGATKSGKTIWTSRVGGMSDEEYTAYGMLPKTEADIAGRTRAGRVWDRITHVRSRREQVAANKRLSRFSTGISKGEQEAAGVRQTLAIKRAARNLGVSPREYMLDLEASSLQDLYDIDIIAGRTPTKWSGWRMAMSGPWADDLSVDIGSESSIQGWSDDALKWAEHYMGKRRFGYSQEEISSRLQEWDTFLSNAARKGFPKEPFSGGAENARFYGWDPGSLFASMKNWFLGTKSNPPVFGSPSEMSKLRFNWGTSILEQFQDKAPGAFDITFNPALAGGGEMIMSDALISKAVANGSRPILQLNLPKAQIGKSVDILLGRSTQQAPSIAQAAYRIGKTPYKDRVKFLTHSKGAGYDEYWGQQKIWSGYFDDVIKPTISKLLPESIRKDKLGIKAFDAIFADEFEGLTRSLYKNPGGFASMKGVGDDFTSSMLAFMEDLFDARNFAGTSDLSSAIKVSTGTGITAPIKSYRGPYSPWSPNPMENTVMNLFYSRRFGKVDPRKIAGFWGKTYRNENWLSEVDEITSALFDDALTRMRGSNFSTVENDIRSFIQKTQGKWPSKQAKNLKDIINFLNTKTTKRGIVGIGGAISEEDAQVARLMTDIYHRAYFGSIPKEYFEGSLVDDFLRAQEGYSGGALWKQAQSYLADKGAFTDEAGNTLNVASWRNLIKLKTSPQIRGGGLDSLIAAEMKEYSGGGIAAGSEITERGNFLQYLAGRVAKRYKDISKLSPEERLVELKRLEQIAAGGEAESQLAYSFNTIGEIIAKGIDSGREGMFSPVIDRAIKEYVTPRDFSKLSTGNKITGIRDVYNQLKAVTESGGFPSLRGAFGNEYRVGGFWLSPGSEGTPALLNFLIKQGDVAVGDRTVPASRILSLYSKQVKVGERTLREGSKVISPIVEDIMETRLGIWEGPVNAEVGLTSVASISKKLPGLQIINELLETPGQIKNYGIEDINRAMSELSTLGVRGIDKYYDYSQKVFGDFPKGIQGPLNVIKSRIGEDYPQFLTNLTNRINVAMGTSFDETALEAAFNKINNNLVIPFGGGKNLPWGARKGLPFVVPSDVANKQAYINKLAGKHGYTKATEFMLMLGSAPEETEEGLNYLQLMSSISDDSGEGLIQAGLPGRMQMALGKMLDYSGITKGTVGGITDDAVKEGIETFAGKAAQGEAAAGAGKLLNMTSSGAKGWGMIAAGAGALILAGALIKSMAGPKDMPPENMPYADSYPSNGGMQMPMTQEMANMPSTMVAMNGAGYSSIKPRGVMYDITANIPNPPDVGQFIDQVNGMLSLESGMPLNMNVHYSGNDRPTSQNALDDMLARKVRR